MSGTTLLLDVNETLLDLAPAQLAVSAALGDKPHLAQQWFVQLLHRSLVLTVAGQYQAFTDIAAALLVELAEQEGIRMSASQAADSLSSMARLPPHDDVIPALRRLRAAGFRLYALSNSSAASLQAQLQFAGLTALLDGQLSVQGVGKYKPHPQVYHWAAAQAGAQVQACMMVAAHDWDVAGARWAGLQAAYVARAKPYRFAGAPQPQWQVADFCELANVLLKQS